MPLSFLLGGLGTAVLLIVLLWAFLYLEGKAQTIAGLALDAIAITLLVTTILIGVIE